MAKRIQKQVRPQKPATPPTGNTEPRPAYREQGSGQTADDTLRNIDNAIAGHKALNNRPSKAEAKEKQALGVGTANKSAGGDEGRPSLYNPSPNGSNRMNWMRRHRRKFGVGGISTVVLVTYIFSILSGPFQFIHLSQVLGKFSLNNKSAISQRSGSYLANRRAINTGRVGETRVGAAGSRVMKAFEAQLGEAGIKPVDTGAGRLGGVEIETTRNENFRGGTPEEQRLKVEKYYSDRGIKVKSVTQTSRLEGKVTVDFEQNTKNLRKASSSLIEIVKGTGTWTRLTAMSRRLVASKFWNLPSLLNPIKQRTAGIPDKIDTRVAKVAERFKARNPKLSSTYDNARSSIKKAFSPFSKLASGVLTFTGLACVVWNVADEIPLANFAIVVAPAAIEATDKVSLGDMVKNGGDIDLEQLGAESESLVDSSGNSIWQGKALDALARGGTGKGEEMKTDYQQAFSSSTTTETIKTYLKTLGGGGILVNGITCSKAGLAVQLLGSVALLAITGPEGIAAKAAIFGRSTVVSVGLISLFSKLALDHFSPEDISTFAGAQGGNLLAYGARAASNLDAISMGGVAIDDSETTTVFKEASELDQREFHQKSLFAQLFDLNDYRSVAAHGMQSVATAGIPQSMTNMASSIFSPTRLVNSFASIFSSRVGAAEEPYDWDFPLFTIPSKIIDDPQYDNPFDNASQAVGIFEDDDGGDYIAKARSCFGVNIDNSDGLWNATPAEVVTPTSEDYIGKKCGDLTDKRWVRTMLFVFDTSVMRLMDCNEGNEQACSEIGLDTGTSSSPTGVNGLECPSNLETKVVNGDTYYQMPEASNNEYSFVSTSPSRTYGSKELVCAIHTVSKAFKDTYGPDSQVKVHDLNAEGHQSHNIGIALDIHADPKPCVANWTDDGCTEDSYDTDATIDFGKMWVDTGILQDIWWCPPGVGNDATTGGDGSMEAIRQYAEEKGSPINIKCIWDNKDDPSTKGHSDHFHVNILDKYKLSFWEPS